MFREKYVFMEEAAAGEGEGGAGGEAAPSWYYQAPAEDNIGVGGTGDAPEWLNVSKYKSVEDQAKAYPELAGRFGGFTGAPEDYALPEGMNAEEMDGGLLDITREIGKEYQMSQNMFNDLVSKVSEYQTKQYEDGQTAAKEALGENAEARIQGVQDWINVNAPQEIVDMIVPMATSAESIQALEFFIEKSKGSAPADQNAQAPTKLTQSEYSEQLMAKDGHGNLRITTDPDYKKKMDELTLQMM